MVSNGAGKGDTAAPAAPALIYVKKVEVGLRSYIESKTCLRDKSDKYFDNPPDVRKGMIIYVIVYLFD